MTRPSPSDTPPVFDRLASYPAASQHRPRPLPLFLDMLRSETSGDASKMAAALKGLRAYQTAARPEAMPAMPIVAQSGRAMLRDYGGAGRPVIVVPSLINPPNVLDLLPDISLMRWLATQGLHPLLVDWATPEPAERNIDIAGHIETLLLPLIDTVGSDAALAGYCLGGTMALAAAALRPPAALALIAAPWRFGGFPDEARNGLKKLWQQAEPSAETMGLLPLEVLQAAFWRLDPARTIGKFVAFGTKLQDEEAVRRFVALEDWANDGSALTFAAGRELALEMFGEDRPGSGRWSVGERSIDGTTLACPVLDIVSTTDRIVPAESAASIGRRLTLTLGHVGMMVGSRARTMLWEPLAQWLRDPE